MYTKLTVHNTVRALKHDSHVRGSHVRTPPDLRFRTASCVTSHWHGFSRRPTQTSSIPHTLIASPQYGHALSRWQRGRSLLLDGSLSDAHPTPRYVCCDLIFVLHIRFFFKSNFLVLVLAAVTILDLALFSPHFWRQSRCQSLSLRAVARQTSWPPSPPLPPRPCPCCGA